MHATASLAAPSLKAHADRELALFKVGVAHGADRSEVLEVTSIFGGKVVDVAPSAVTIAVSGDPGKLYAFEMLMQPFGLMELSRTGRITLLRSDVNLDLPSLQEYSAGAPAAKLQEDFARAEQGAYNNQDLHHLEGVPHHMFSTAADSPNAWFDLPPMNLFLALTMLERLAFNM